MTTSDEYLELRLMNNTKEPIDAKIRNERMFPIINTTNHYTMSVVRFDAGNTKVPIFIPEVKRPNHDLAYDDNDNLRNLFNNQPVVLKPFNGVNIQQSGKFDIYGDYIAMVSTNKRYKKRTPGSFLETTIDNTNPAYKVGVWNRHTGDCLWVYDLSNLQIASSTVGGANYAGTFFSVVGCRFSNDGANLIIFVSYTLFSEGSMAGRYLHYVQLPATTGGTLGTVSFSGFGIPYDIPVDKIERNMFKCTGDYIFVPNTGNTFGIYSFPSLVYITHFAMPFSGAVRIDAVSSPANKVAVMANGAGTGILKVYGHNGTTFTEIGNYNVTNEIDCVSVSPDGNHIIVVSYNPLTQQQTITVLNKTCTVVYKTFDFNSLGYVSNVEWKPILNLTAIVPTADMDAKFRVIYTIQAHTELSQVKVFSYKFTSNTWDSSTFIHQEIYHDEVAGLLLNSKMSKDGEELITSQVDPLTLYGNQSTMRQSIEKIIRNEYDNIPEKWKAEITTNRTATHTNLQMLLEHHYIPSNKNSKWTAVSSYVKWKNEDYDLVGYSNLAQYKKIDFSRVAVLSDEFYHCFSLDHFAKLLDETLKTIFAPFDELFNEKVSCKVYDNKMLMISFPSNAFDYDFRLIINQELNSILGFHTVPHETIEGAYVFVIKKGVIQKSNGKWSIVELFRPSQMFPFKSIVFTSNDLKTRPIKRFNSNHNEEKQRNSIITDLLLTVDDIPNFYDTMVHTPETQDRQINIDNGYQIKNVTIEVMLETSDGYQVPLKLDVLQSCGLLLKIHSE